MKTRYFTNIGEDYRADQTDIDGPYGHRTDGKIHHARHPLDQHRYAGWDASDAHIKTVPHHEFTIPTNDPFAPVWGNISVQRRGALEGPFSYPYVMTSGGAGGRMLIIAEWEWDTGVRMLFGEPYRLGVKPMRFPAASGEMVERWIFTLTFRNGFSIELWMDDDIQERITPAIRWPGDTQVDYREAMTTDELLRLFDHVIGQGGMRREDV